MHGSETDDSVNEVLFTALDLDVRTLEPADGPRVQQLVESDEEYFLTTFGLPPGPSEAQSLYPALPEGAHYEDKFLLGAFGKVGAGETLTAVIDLIRDHPVAGCRAVGPIFVDPGQGRRGTGLQDSSPRSSGGWPVKERVNFGLGRRGGRRARRNFLGRAGFVPSAPGPLPTGIPLGPDGADSVVVSQAAARRGRVAAQAEANVSHLPRRTTFAPRSLGGAGRRRNGGRHNP